MSKRGEKKRGGRAFWSFPPLPPSLADSAHHAGRKNRRRVPPPERKGGGGRGREKKKRGRKVHFQDVSTWWPYRLPEKEKKKKILEKKPGSDAIHERGKEVKRGRKEEGRGDRAASRISILSSFSPEEERKA